MEKGHEAANEAHSSSGLGHRPLKAEITGSNPVCATSPIFKDVSSQMRKGLRRFHCWAKWSDYSKPIRLLNNRQLTEPGTVSVRAASSTVFPAFVSVRNKVGAASLTSCRH